LQRLLTSRNGQVETDTLTDQPNELIYKIPLKPCALNAEIQHFVLRFNKISLLYGYQLKEGLGGERRPKDRVKTADMSTLHQISFIYLSQSENSPPKKTLTPKLYVDIGA
jgi:hypothetical protein